MGKNDTIYGPRQGEDPERIRATTERLLAPSTEAPGAKDWPADDDPTKTAAACEQRRKICAALQVPRELLETHPNAEGLWIVSGSPSEKQMILMALALTSLTFPGWDHELSLLAARFGGFVMFQELKRYRRDAGSPKSGARPRQILRRR